MYQTVETAPTTVRSTQFRKESLFETFIFIFVFTVLQNYFFVKYLRSIIITYVVTKKTNPCIRIVYVESKQPQHETVTPIEENIDGFLKFTNNKDDLKRSSLKQFRNPPICFPEAVGQAEEPLVRVAVPEEIIMISTILNISQARDIQVLLKGTVSRDFLLQVFFMNHLPPRP